MSPPFPTPCSPELQGTNHTLRHGHTQRHADTHACKHKSANTHAHSLRFTPVSLLPTRKGERGTSPPSVPNKRPCVYFPDETVIFPRSEFPWSVCLPLPKVKSRHEIKLKGIGTINEDFLQSMAPCASWN